jgi:hypothetical protein
MTGGGAESSGRSGRSDRTGRAGPRWRCRALIVAVLVLIVGFGVATLPLFVWPSQGVPDRVNAIVMLDGPGDRLTTAEDLARAHRAPVLVISLGSRYSGSGCVGRVPGVTVICFNPDPPTTRGEAEYVGRLGHRYHWRSIVLVTVTPQITVGRIWISRCFGGKIYAVAAPLGASNWPFFVLHEWGATIKAELLQRSC